MALIKPEQLRSGSYSISGSFSGSFFGDGSGLTGVISSKWTGSNPITRNSNVEITGSLTVLSVGSTFGEDNIGKVIISDDSYGGELGLITDLDETIAIKYSDGTFRYGGNAPGSEPIIVNGNDITLTGSLKLEGPFTITGSIKLDPTQDPDPAGLDLDTTALFQSASNTSLGYDLYIRQNGNLIKWKWVEGIVNTGLLYGGVVTYSGTDVFVSPGSGIIVNHNATTGSEISPIVEYVTWNAITQSITNIATQQVTYLYIDNTGTLQQQSSRFTNEQYHDYIPLGAVGHFDYTQVSAFGGQVQTAYDQIAQISSFVDAFGPLKISGYGITGQPGTLRLSVGSGISFIHGGFYEEDPELPSQITTPAQATASMAYVYRSGSGVRFDTNGGNLYTQLKPGFYDPGTGVTGSVSNNDWTIQRVYSDPKTGVLYVYFGQTIYPDFLTAVADLSTDPFTEGDTFDFTTFIGFLVLKSNGTNITAADNKIVPAGLFRGSGQGSGGGVAISNLDDLTDVSITGPTNGEALIYDSGIWQNGTPLNATSASFASSGNGIFSGSFSGSFTGDGSQLTGIVSSKWSGSNPITRTGDVEITGSFKVAGQTTLYTTGSGTLTVQGSGSAQPLFLVTGSIGELLSVTDQDDPNEPLLIVSGSAGQLFVVENSTTGSLLQIYDTASNSIFEINNDAEIIYGVSSSIFATQYLTIAATASYQTIYNIETGSYTGAFINYTVTSASNAAAGQIMSVWNSGTASYTETATTDIGDTSQIAFDVIMTGSVAQIAVSASLTTGWQVKTTLNIL
jgi:hypothetical protein